MKLAVMKGANVGATIKQEMNGVLVMHASGALHKEELDTVQDALLKNLGPQESIKLLVTVGDDFCGWIGGEVWSDMDFFVEHGDRIEKIAIVGDATWETEMLMFAAAGLRRAPVKYFAPNQLAEAYEWLG